MSLEGKNLETVNCVSVGAILDNSFVKLSSSSSLTQLAAVEQCGAGDPVFGVAGQAANDGECIPVVIRGVGKCVILGENVGHIAPGAQLKADANGRPILTTTALDNTGGRALDTADNAGEYLRIVVESHSSVKAAS